MAEIIVTLVVVGLGAWAAIYFIDHRIVYEYQHGVLFEKGRFVRVLEAGEYWVFKWRNNIELVDGRKSVLTVPGQEVLSKDGVTVKLSVLLHYQVSDAKKALIEHASYLESLYAVVQSALREIIGNGLIEELLPAKDQLGEQLEKVVSEHAAALGLSLESVAIKDIMFPGPLKESFSQVARARQDGLAALERARGESASLRKLANAAKMIESNPALYRLRALQAVDGASSVVVHLGPEGGAESNKTLDA